MTDHPHRTMAHLAADQLADDLLFNRHTWVGPDGLQRWAMTPAELELERRLVPNADERAVSARGPYAVVQARTLDQACYRASLLLAYTRDPELVTDALYDWRVDQRRSGAALEGVHRAGDLAPRADTPPTRDRRGLRIVGTDR